MSASEDAILDEIAALELVDTTPLEALNLLFGVQQRLHARHAAETQAQSAAKGRPEAEGSARRCSLPQGRADRESPQGTG